MEEFDAEVDRMEQELLDSGAMYISGVDEEGEFILRFNMDILKEVNEELYWWHMNNVDEAILGLIDKGLVELDMDPDGTSSIRVTELGHDVRNWAQENT